MKLEITKEKEMPLLERKRVTAQVVFQGATPSKSDIRKDIAKKLKTDEKLVAIRHVFQKFGTTNAKVIVHVYKDFKKLCSLEKSGKKAGEDIKKVEEKTPEAPKEEPKPEKKEEAKEEKKEEKPKEQEAPKEEKAEEKKAEAPKEASEEPKENKKEEKGKS